MRELIECMLGTGLKCPSYRESNEAGTNSRCLFYRSVQ